VNEHTELLTAAINLLEAWANQMVTETHWEALVQAVKEQAGRYIQWRSWDERKAQ